MNDHGENWITETLHPGFQQRFEASKILYRSQTELQDLIIFENPFFGRILVLDGVIQTTQRDEPCYHEMLSHVPIFGHGDVKEVLIIGGGDGGALRDVLRHKSVERATMVEIDGNVVEMCKEYLPTLSAGAFDDPRADVVIADGVKYVAETDRRFDVIIIDSTDPMGPAVPLFSDEFYGNCRDLLTDDGVLVSQSGVAFVQSEETKGTLDRLRRLFPDPALYVTQVPTYAFGYMTLGWGAKSDKARTTDPAVIRQRFEAADIETFYYTPGIHQSCFNLPAYMKY
ncbi:MAG: polyamine aminopropyltransferase [Alphaproteobacteria bacterium]